MIKGISFWLLSNEAKSNVIDSKRTIMLLSSNRLENVNGVFDGCVACLGCREEFKKGLTKQANPTSHQSKSQ
jgi:hypothetical protein